MDDRDDRGPGPGARFRVAEDTGSVLRAGRQDELFGEESGTALTDPTEFAEQQAAAEQVGQCGRLVIAQIRRSGAGIGIAFIEERDLTLAGAEGEHADAPPLARDHVVPDADAGQLDLLYLNTHAETLSPQ